MVEDTRRLEHTNTVEAVFRRKRDAEAALSKLKSVGVADCSMAPHDHDGIQLQVNALAHEGLVREIIAEYGGTEVDLPG